MLFSYWILTIKSLVANLGTIHFSDNKGVIIENNNFLTSSRTYNSYSGTILESGFYIVFASFYSSVIGGATTLKINDKTIINSFASTNNQMPIFYSGFFNKNDVIKITSNAENSESVGINNLSIIKFWFEFIC